MKRQYNDERPRSAWLSHSLRPSFFHACTHHETPLRQQSAAGRTTLRPEQPSSLPQGVSGRCGRPMTGSGPIEDHRPATRRSAGQSRPQRAGRGHLLLPTADSTSSPVTRDRCSARVTSAWHEKLRSYDQFFQLPLHLGWHPFLITGTYLGREESLDRGDHGESY